MDWQWQLIEEEKALKALRKVIDRTMVKLMEPGLDESEAEELMRGTRSWVLKVFPDKASVYDLIYRPRFHNIYNCSKRQP